MKSITLFQLLCTISDYIKIKVFGSCGELIGTYDFKNSIDLSLNAYEVDTIDIESDNTLNIVVYKGYMEG